ncbi:hypothetical protein [Haloplanus rubicundus]|uniref:hypothetical protein n=1 Tax=Haloplanus rubicundus TaxID=1547898 RepID=UPI001300941B|nr:hypothetical protein [Haloplanus rubicundus]
MPGEGDDGGDSEQESVSQQNRINLARRGFLVGALGSVAFDSLPVTADTDGFEELWSIPLSHDKTELMAVDANDDGTPEVAVGDNGDFGPGEFGIVDNGTFVWKESSPAEVRPKATGDIDGDGTSEVIFAAKVARQWVRPYTYDGDFLWSGLLC